MCIHLDFSVVFFKARLFKVGGNGTLLAGKKITTVLLPQRLPDRHLVMQSVISH